jgi:hypothetical protein
MYIQRHRRREIVRMSLTPLPHTVGNAVPLAVMQMLELPETLEQLERTTGGDEPHQLPSLECLKSLDDLDEEEDSDDDDEDDDLADEEDEDDLDEDYDEDEDEDDEDEDEEDEDDDGGVKPLKMASARSGSSRE